MSPTPTDRVASALRRQPVIDTHNDLPWTARVLADYDLQRLDLTVRRHDTHTDLPRLREGGVGAQFWSVFVPGTWSDEAAVAATFEQIAFVEAMLREYPEGLAPARTAADVRASVSEGRIACLMGAEGGQSIGCSMATLRALWDRGVGYLTLTHNQHVPWADAATMPERLGGLSAFGREVVREMNRLGMLVDLSHVSLGTMRDALDVSEAPVIFSHSSAYAVTPHVRNAPDDVLRALRDNGGVCQVTFVPEFVNDTVRQWTEMAALDAAAVGVNRLDYQAFTDFMTERSRTLPKPDAYLEDVVRHVEHVREVAGLEHVGLGGDYDGNDSFPDGLRDVTGYPRLLAALADRGWTEDDLVALTGGNMLRVMERAEQVATDLQARREPSQARIDDLD